MVIIVQNQCQVVATIKVRTLKHFSYQATVFLVKKVKGKNKNVEVGKTEENKDPAVVTQEAVDILNKKGLYVGVTLGTEMIKRSSIEIVSHKMLVEKFKT